MTEATYIQERTGIAKTSVSNTLKLLREDATIPFISRYRKEVTGDLDEVQVSEILQFKEAFEALEKRKETVLKNIEAQDALTPDLEERIRSATDLTRVEDLYLPFRKKRKTRADTAREAGLEPLAKIMMAQKAADMKTAAIKFISKEVVSVEDALAGARDIAAEWINENQGLRKALRRLFRQQAMLTAKVIAKKEQEEQAQKFRNYFDWQESLKNIPSHRLLAILRAEKEGILRVRIEVDRDRALDTTRSFVIRPGMPGERGELETALEDAYKRLLLPALSNEARSLAKEKADDQAISVFADNLRQLLLAPPLGAKRILALDPGFKSGCKVVCLDAQGNLEHNETIFPHPPQKQLTLASKKIKSLVNAHRIEAIAIGNGTASRETEAFIKKIRFDREVLVFVVNEAGASVYSASKEARAEFAQYDVTVRGAVSIGRRLADPLAELVKIDPKAIGVGQYQHDVDQGKLKAALERVVESCVNGIGVNVNTASQALLSYISGIGPSLASKIVEYRQDNGSLASREELLKVSRLGAKAYQQAAGFLRIPGALNPLDNSAVHPERYALVSKMAEDLGTSVSELIGNHSRLEQINLNDYTTNNVGLPTLKDILAELEKPGVDPRKAAKVFEFDPSVRSLADVSPGMKLPGIVNNITNFGCFVDIGIKESGLVHISKLAREYVNDVNSIVKLHQHVEVTVLAVDQDRKRVQLSLID